MDELQRRKGTIETGCMPRRFWVYTAGRDDPKAQEREARREQRLHGIRTNEPSLLALGIVVMLFMFMLLMMLAEFRGYFLDQLPQILTPQ